MRNILLFALLTFTLGCAPGEEPGNEGAPQALRIATFNVEDVRGDDLRDAGHLRLRAAAAVLQRLRPDVVLINEIAFDQPGSPGFEAGAPPGRNGQRFADTFVAVSQGDSLEPLRYTAFMAPSNTGLASGLDLDNDGTAVTDYPVPPPAGADGSPGQQTPGGRAYGNDAWGFGTFPGQYALAVLVRDGLEVLDDEVRTFQTLPWHTMPDALRPVDPETGRPWYSDAEWEAVRLSSKSHWDVPVRLPGGAVVHVLASHPTPPAFDGPEQRNKRRNHDEIRFWADYLDGASYIVDDRGAPGGLPAGEHFVILGDLNADPDEGNSVDDPIGTFLLRHSRINGAFVPLATEAGRAAFPDLDPDDTARWGLRVDYVLPSASLEVRGGGIRREAEPGAVAVSDHFPVWIDVVVPPVTGR